MKYTLKCNGVAKKFELLKLTTESFNYHFLEAWLKVLLNVSNLSDLRYSYSNVKEQRSLYS